MKKTETHDSAGELYDTIVALGLLSTAEKDCLDAGPDIRGGYAFSCPACDKVLSIYPGVVECRNEACRLLEWGDWADVAQAMAARASDAAGEGDEAKRLDALLDGCEFDLDKKPERPIALYSLAGQVIGTEENIMVVQAKIKAGKSSAIGAMLASTCPGAADCLGFASSNLEGRAVLHFDTEQSRFDHFNLVLRSMVRAQLHGPPPWLKSWHFKGKNIADMLALVERAMRRTAKRFGGLHSVVLDGIADLCADVNDAAEAAALVSKMEGLAVEHKCLIVCVIHENHSSGDGKTRGHLGSQLARKAETNLRIEKGDDGTSIMFAEAARSAHIPKKEAVAFRWSENELCHVTVTDTPEAQKRAREIDAWRALAAQVFNGHVGGVSWSELKAGVAAATGVAEKTAEGKIRKMVGCFAVKKKGNTYVLANPQPSN